MISINLRSLLYVLLSLLIFPNTIFCQETITGNIISKEDGKAISGANICIYNSERTAVLGYTFSSKEGSFILNIKNIPQIFFLEVSSMGYKTYGQMFETFPVVPVGIELETAEITLREVKIRAPKVSLQSDTVNYTTAGFAKEQDKSIGEVLKRIPGVDVAKTGQVTYKDKPINALYIDGKNLLDGQYAVATQNIKPDVVSMIQIFENHQPIKVLEKFNPSDNAAINLKLNPKVRSKWVASVDLGAGVSPALWDARVLLFQFSGKLQSMNLLKSNNVGSDIGWETREQNLGASSESQLIDPTDINIVNVTGNSTLPVGEERNMFNKSYLFSSNTLFSLGKNLQAVVKLSYLHDLQERWQEQRTEYIMEGEENIVIQEDNRYSGCKDMPEFDVVIKSNTANIFLQNRINGKIRFSNNLGSTEGSMKIEQQAKIRQYDFSEIFSFIKPMGRTIFKVSSNTNLKSLPHNLSVSSENTNQSVNLFQIISNNKAGFQRSYGRFSGEMNGGVNMIYQKMESFLNKYNLTNNLDWKFTEIFITNSLRYESDNLRIVLDLPVKMQNSSLRFTPVAALRYKFSPFWEGWLVYNHNTNHTGIMEMNSNYILADYRSLTKGYNEMLESRRNIISANIQFNNPLKLLNLYASCSYNKSVNGYTISMRYMDFYNFRTILPEERGSSGLSFVINATKSFFDSPLLLDIKSDYSIFDNSMIQQDKDTRFRTLAWNIRPKIEATLWDVIDFDFYTAISISRRTSGDGTVKPARLVNYNPAFTISYKLSEKFRSQAKFDYYVNEMTNGNYSDCFFADIRAVYTLGKGELSVDWANVFNRRSYRYTLFSELSTIEREFRLRPWNLILSYSFTL